jgi:hypothetical protein
MSIETTFERIALALEKLVELEMAASQAVLGTVEPVAEVAPAVTEPPKVIDWNPKSEATMLRYSQEKKDAVMTVAAELGVSTEGTTGEIHARILEAIKPVEPVEPEAAKPAATPEVVEPEEVLDLPTVRKYVVAYVNNGRGNAEGVALINGIAGVSKLVDVDPKHYAEIVRAAKAGA